MGSFRVVFVFLLQILRGYHRAPSGAGGSTSRCQRYGSETKRTHGQAAPLQHTAVLPAPHRDERRGPERIVIVVAKTREACMVCDISILRRTNRAQKDAFDAQLAGSVPRLFKEALRSALVEVRTHLNLIEHFQHDRIGCRLPAERHGQVAPPEEL
jgi:hypothetical protein